jgi:hypothetical protein
MPCSFTYEGDPFDHGGRCNNVRNILLKVPKYVDTYLDELFSGAPSFIDDEATTRRAFGIQTTSLGLPESEQYRISRFMGTNIEQQRTYRYFALLALRDKDSRIDGVDLEHAVRLLARYGSALFTEKSVAGRMEAALLVGNLPKLNRQQLRKTIRQFTIEYIVDLLGFDVVQWNRRER